MIKLGYVATLLLPALCVLATSACTPTKPVQQAPVTITGCQAFPRLTASRQDTAQTREAILAYVTTWDALCAPAAKP